MPYTIKALADMAGVSTRTLRYYDEIGLLVAKRAPSSAYRLYGPEEVNRLQQILLYREMDLSLETIKQILEDPTFDTFDALALHKKRLREKIGYLETLLQTVEKTGNAKKGRGVMEDREKFEGLKKEQLRKSEKQYGEEARQLYGKEAVEASNQQFFNLSKDDYEAMQATERALFVAIEDCLDTVDMDPSSAKAICTLHKKWLSYTWPTYSEEAHLGLVTMYQADERFTAYYDDQLGIGATKRLAEAVAMTLK